MYGRICKYCGKKFYTKSLNRQFCSKACRMDAKDEERYKEDDQPCWICKKACGTCTWSAAFIPVNGWEATPVTVKDKEGDIRSYKISKCPEFIFG